MLFRSLAGGIGSALADLLGGYFIYVPVTLAVKGLVALSCGFIFQHMKNTPRSRGLAVVLGGISDIVLVAGGYFLCEIPMYGIPGAAASIPANLIQGTGGLVLACILYPFLISVPGHSVEIDGIVRRIDAVGATSVKVLEIMPVCSHSLWQPFRRLPDNALDCFRTFASAVRPDDFEVLTE